MVMFCFRDFTAVIVTQARFTHVRLNLREYIIFDRAVGILFAVPSTPYVALLPIIKRPKVEIWIVYAFRRA